MKKISNTLNRINTIEIYSGGLALLILVSAVTFFVFGSNIVNNLILYFTVIGFSLLQALRLDYQVKIKKFILDFTCDLNSEKANALDGQDLFVSDAFPAYWSGEWIYLVVHPVLNPKDTYIFSVKKYWYESTLDLQKYYRFTHFRFEAAQDDVQKFHPEFSSNLCFKNFFC